MRHFLLGRTRKFTPESRYPLTDLSRALSHTILCLWNNCGFKRNGQTEFMSKNHFTHCLAALRILRRANLKCKLKLQLKLVSIKLIVPRAPTMRMPTTTRRDAFQVVIPLASVVDDVAIIVFSPSFTSSL